VTTTEQFIVWMLQTVYTNNAAAVAEGALKPESAVRWDEVKDQLEKIAHWIPLTTEVLKYNPRLMQLLDNEMIGMLRLKLEELMVTGHGRLAAAQGLLHPARRRHLCAPERREQRGRGLPVARPGPKRCLRGAGRRVHQPEQLSRRSR
jgi:HK97 family phage major capsid protein